MLNIFVFIYSFFLKNRKVFYPVFIIAFLITAYFASKVKFKEDLSAILPKDKKVEKLNRIFQGSKFLDRLVIMVSLKDTSEAKPDSLVAFADKFAKAAEFKLQPYYKKFNTRVDEDLAFGLINTVIDQLPIYLEETDYAEIDSLISENGIKASLEQNIRTLSSPAGMAVKQVISNDPVGISFIGLKKLQQLQYDENYQLYDGYVTTKDQKNLLLFITPAYPPDNTGKNAEFLNALDELLEKLVPVDANLNIQYFGGTAVSAGNALQLKRDTFFTQGVVIIFLLIFFGVYFRRVSAPVVILIPVLFGALFSLAAIYFLKGSISVIAIGTGSVILGIAVNYSLHVYNHFRHTRSMDQVIKDLTVPLTVGSFTTIGGFLCLQFVESEMLKDLGLFAAFSLIGASLSSLIFLPLFIAGNKSLNESGRITRWIDKVAAFRPDFNKYFIGLIFLLTIGFAFLAPGVSFESDLLDMNYMSPELKAAESRLTAINKFSERSVYVVTEGKTLEEALRNTEHAVNEIESLKGNGKVLKYTGVSSVILSDSLQQEKIDRWNHYWNPEKKNKLLTYLKTEGERLGYRSNAFDKFSNLLNKEYHPKSPEHFEGIRENFLGDYINERPGNVNIVTLLKVPEGGASPVYNTFEGHKDITVVDRQYLTSRFIEIIKDDFNSIAWMTSLLVFGVLLLIYGRIELALVSFIPMLISWVWILGLMNLFDIHFNIINIIISALIFGLGDDYSLFIMNGLLQEYKSGKKNLSSFKSSIYLSAITTLAGLGVLIFAKHPALQSIAVISMIGILCVLIMSQVLIPFFFNLIIRRRAEKKLFPWTLSSFLLSAFAFSYFVLGCIILTILGIAFIPFNLLARKQTKYVYHVILSVFARSLMYIMINVRKHVINSLKEDFSKPSVIICNHQSFLDILSIIMLHPKLILFTNKWVWNSPVFGAVVRMADYYPIAQGAELSIEKLKSRVKEGYSIMVFPEGTRSPDGNMKRFHKGAFYLAESLGIDILPIVLHGTGHTMGKSDFYLKNGKITVKFLPRISVDDETYGRGYAEKAKNIGKYFRAEYNLLRSKTESPKYFKQFLFSNYIYKGPVLEWYMKIKVRLEKFYAPFHKIIPPNAKILDIGCGYGFMSYMLKYTGPNRSITGIDYDAEKIAVANNCLGRNDHINFVAADVVLFPFENYDVIILADILHYLQPEEQTQVIQKCINHLKPEGLIILRDGNTDLERRHRGTRLTEFFSTKFSGFNKTNAHGLSFLSGKMIREFVNSRQMECIEVDDTKLTSNIVYIIKHNSEFKHEPV